ncbi:bile acid:sodium symporter family protein [Lysinibacillus xylanilyticus]|uniref:bile acid:sodium symporter family protein n=1 Tax=Lysinibacillus xylanilyticus TaxID=582475 RepID=UPI002B255E62|nr:bile acid:sodium symporter family protein [Lysinibacillus xylanilyticus]MEB2299448.1 bile acid:sodium symporter family protein [Lysinibacillus xylanilyticus]
MLNSFNKYLQKWMPILTPLSLVIGVLLGNVGHQLLFLIPWLFAFMTFAGSLNMSFEGIKDLRKYSKVIVIALVFLHLMMPMWAYFVSTVIFHDHLLTIGFVLAVAVPTGVTSFIWVSICRGHLPLCLAIILIDTLISPVVIPALLHIVVGQTIEIDTASLMLDLLWMIVVPSLVGVALNELTKGNIVMTLGKKLAPFSKLSLFSIVMINSSAIAPYIKHISWELVGVILVVFVLAVSGYALCLVLGHILWKDISIITMFVFTGGMRNIAVGVVIATTYFPTKTVMPVVFGMLFQQVLASFFSRIVEQYQLKVAKG